MFGNTAAFTVYKAGFEVHAFVVLNITLFFPY